MYIKTGRPKIHFAPDQTKKMLLNVLSVLNNNDTNKESHRHYRHNQIINKQTRVVWYIKTDRQNNKEK